MAYKVAIDAAAGGTNDGATGNGLVEKDYTLLISKYISDRLNSLGIENFLVRSSDETLSDEQRVDIINNKYGTGNNVIVISNRLSTGTSNGAEIMYPLRSNSRLASSIAGNLESAGQTVLKYYQLRNSDNTALDDDYLIRNTTDNQTIAINYGYVGNASDANFLKNNYEVLAEAVVKSIADYAGVTYTPSNLDGYYIVQKGDSLWSIASKTGTSVNELKTINNLSSNTLQIGQLLKLPTPSNNVETNTIQNTYTVQKGDSLWAIANKLGTTVNELKTINNLSSDILQIGQILKLSTSDNANNVDNNIYTVQKGDSLWAIANKYGTTVDNIKKANNLSTDNLSIGQSLIIPSTSLSSQTEITYTVQKGDSLWAIANKYDTTVDKIISTNNLKTTTLSIGQVLIVPSTSSFTTYTVQKGDSLWLIASKYNTTVDNIKKLNGLSTDNLSIGQKLLLPI